MIKKRILVVDDDRDMADGLADVLDLVGYQVKSVYSGQDAVTAYEEAPFDAVFVDVKMPGMNGIECLSKIRELDPEAKVVVMTGFSLKQMLEKAVEFGAAAILRKPFAPNQVFEELKKVLPQGIVLVVDDDADFAEAAKNVLAEHNFEVHLASNGADAIERVLAGGIDVLVLDLKMPIMSGLEVYLEIKRRQPPPPTIIVTGYAEEFSDDISTLRSMEVTGYLAKPFDPRSLIKIANDMISNRTNSPALGQ